MLKCGCNAMATHNNAHDGLESGHPTCIAHECCIVVETPDLSGRRARCIDYGRPLGRRNECDDCSGTCTHERDSSVNSAFFSYKPDSEFDTFYCGCFGWD